MLGEGEETKMPGRLEEIEQRGAIRIGTTGDHIPMLNL